MISEAPAALLNIWAHLARSIVGHQCKEVWGHDDQHKAGDVGAQVRLLPSH